jgi:hypothetical protein
MKQRGIAFTAEMVRAILEGRKSQTRRVCHSIPDRVEELETFTLGSLAHGDSRTAVTTYYLDGDHCTWFFPAKHGVPSDRLWLREAWRTVVEFNPLNAAQIASDFGECGYDSTSCPIEYVADHQRRGLFVKDAELGRHRAARFMPRWASRIDLEITAVRVERLHDITEADAMLEGVELRRAPAVPDGTEPFPDCWSAGGVYDHTPVGAFSGLWDRINGHKTPWAKNPWVWVLTFKRV